MWTWDVTELNGSRKGDRYKLYVVLDLYSRFVVARMLAIANPYASRNA